MKKLLKLKNKLKVELPFYKISPGETKEITITENDDIHFRGIELGHLILIDEKTLEEPKELEIIEIPKAIVVKKKKKTRR